MFTEQELDVIKKCDLKALKRSLKAFKAEESTKVPVEGEELYKDVRAPFKVVHSKPGMLKCIFTTLETNSVGAVVAEIEDSIHVTLEDLSRLIKQLDK